MPTLIFFNDKAPTETIQLIKYSTRHYAHPSCLQEAKGKDWIKANVHDWMVKLAKENAPPQELADAD